MDRVFAVLSSCLDRNDPLNDLVARKPDLPNGAPIYLTSICKHGNSVLFIARNDEEKFLVDLATKEPDLDPDLAGEISSQEGLCARKCPFSRGNAACLRRKIGWTAPVSLRERHTTFGCGDRIGLASPGHLRALARYRVAPVLAQQSPRELSLTGRDFQLVVDDATFLVFQEGYAYGFGADGDHLKTLAEVDRALEAGMPMITLDCSALLNTDAQHWSSETVETAFAGLPADDQAMILRRYADRNFSFEGTEVFFPAVEAKRCAVIYQKAVAFAKEVYDHLVEKRGKEFDLELSIDETSTPTLPIHHLFIAAELQLRGIHLNSLAPRFVGDFQKGIDYLGDPEEFSQHFKIHSAIARIFGNYKISIHSGSDKFAIYPAIARYARGRFHLKTSGTSWLEALRVVAKEDPRLFRELHASCFAGLDAALKLYHVTADFARAPSLENLPDMQLPDLLDHNETRQLLHISYGTLLSNDDLRPRFFESMHRGEDLYYRLLERHFTKHLRKLNCRKRSADKRDDDQQAP